MNYKLTKKSLEELIEVCGDKFWLLVRVKNKHKRGWVAQSHSDKEGNYIKVNSKTPKEAVYKLYCKIKKNE